MLLFVIILSLTLQPGLSLSKPKPKPEPKPEQRCVNAMDPAKYYTFLKHHLNNGIPKTDNIREWQKFITKIKTWKRPIQSFFLYSEYDKVLAVCSKGGQIYPGSNLCISKKPFNFFNVSVKTNMKVTHVEFIENQHVILGCEKIKMVNQCLPIHFEANINKAKPDNNALDCS